MTKGNGSEFGRKKEAALAALLLGNSQAEAARSVDVDPSTLKRWLRSPDFHAEYLQVRREAVSLANARLQHKSNAIVSMALNLVGDAATPASVKAHLCLGLWDRANKSLETEDLLVRVAAREQSAEASKVR